MIIVISIVAFIAIAVIVLGGIYLFAPKSDPLYIAHKGYWSNCPSNSEEAFLNAAKMNFYGIETDIRKTKDGVYVCNHDETVKMANGEEKVLATTDYADLDLCTLNRYLEICAVGNKIAVIELKEDFDSDSVREILSIVDETYDRSSISIISFHFSVLLRIKAEDPTINLQYLSETENDPYFDRCLTENISLDVSETILTKALVKKFHKVGLPVNAWTVNERFKLWLVRVKKVDYVTTDRAYRN